jgi:hypothetical protein
MRFLRFRSQHRIEDLSKQRAFAEASEQAQFRLEQCIADLHNPEIATENTQDPNAPGTRWEIQKSD